MLENFKSYLKYGNTFCGIEHNTKNGEEEIYGVLLKKTKNELIIDQSFNVTAQEGLFSIINKNQHIAIVINNDKVITKIIKGEFKDSLTALNRTFPNIDIEDFLYEVKIQELSAAVSICRKEYVEELIANYAKNKFNVIDITLGISQLNGILNWIDNTVVNLNTQQISIEKRVIIEISQVLNPADEIYNINGLEVEAKFLLSFSAALSSLVNPQPIDTNFSTRIGELKNDYKHLRIYSLGIKSILGFVFGILLINFLLFNHYYDKNISNGELASFNKMTTNKVKLLKEEVGKNKKLYDDVLRNNVSKSSYYLNRIAYGLPQSIALNEVNYQPLIKKIKKNRDIELLENSIIVIGETTEHKMFSDWINSLENKTWLSSLEIVDFADLSKSKSLFKLKIIVLDESKN